MFGQVVDRGGVAKIRYGTLGFVQGPTYETVAEANLLRQCGAHAVSMSLVPEAIQAHREGMDVLGITCLANKVGGPRTVRHDDVLETAERTAPTVGEILKELIVSSQ
jgi:purine-nucleoside phosphorylase